MKIKMYYGETVRAALDLVKRELGPNALILSTKQVKARPALGLKGALVYEIAAALDWEAEAAPESAPAAAPFNVAERPESEIAGPAPRTGPRKDPRAEVLGEADPV